MAKVLRVAGENQNSASVLVAAGVRRRFLLRNNLARKFVRKGCA